MRAIIQRVKRASVEVEGEVVGSIGRGLLVFLGIHAHDTTKEADWLIKKLIRLRCFSDSEGRMNRSIEEEQGAFLVVSQFTLYANCNRGNRPDFLDAAPPAIALPIYTYFVTGLRLQGSEVATGIFGAHMDVTLCNEGPVTLLVENPS